LAYNACVNDRGKLAVLDIKTIAAKWYLGELSGEDMPSIACEVLEQEHNGVNLRYLAGLSGPARRDILEIVDCALQELGAQLPITRHDAALWMERLVANDIIRGRIEPYGGACRIWFSYASEAPELEHWSNLVIAFEVAAEDGKTEKAQSQIVQAAENLLSATK
jgi:hypothetical protein